MEQINNAFGFLLNLVHWFITMVFLTRILLQFLGVNTTNPVAQAILKMTQPILTPLQGILPPIKRFNTAALFVLLVVQFVILLVQVKLLGVPASLLNIAFSSLWALLEFVIEYYFWCIILSAILSWLPNSAYNPLAQIINAIAAPVLKPISRVLPLIGGIDFSPVVALIIIKLIEILFFSSIY